jgi:hypothetical protein
VQAVQAAHAALKYAVLLPKQTGAWFKDSQVLVLLSVADEAELDDLLICLPMEYDVAAFHEPDRNNELTAIAVESAGASWLAHLPLALKGGE